MSTGYIVGGRWPLGPAGDSLTLTMYMMYLDCIQTKVTDEFPFGFLVFCFLSSEGALHLSAALTACELGYAMLHTRWVSSFPTVLGDWLLCRRAHLILHTKANW